MTPTTLKIFWVLIFLCSIRGFYANATKRTGLHSRICYYFGFSAYMLADLFGYLPPGFIEQFF